MSTKFNIHHPWFSSPDRAGPACALQVDLTCYPGEGSYPRVQWESLTIRDRPDPDDNAVCWFLRRGESALVALAVVDAVAGTELDPTIRAELQEALQRAVDSRHQKVAARAATLDMQRALDDRREEEGEDPDIY